MADAVADAESRLYGLPLEDFTRERDALARELRKDGDKEAAAAVGRLPKPTPVGWAVNRLARDEPALVEALLRAGERLREVQLGGEGRDALREAVAGERAAVDAAVTAARDLRPGGRPLSRPMVDRLRTTLHAAAGDDELRDRIRSGRVAEEAEAGGAWPLGAAPAAAERPAKRAKPAKGATRDRDAEARAAAEREAAARAAEEREAERREAAERRDLEQRLKTARAGAARAAKRLETARTEADAARERLEAARQADEAARDEVARLEERLG